MVWSITDGRMIPHDSPNHSEPELQNQKPGNTAPRDGSQSSQAPPVTFVEEYEIQLLAATKPKKRTNVTSKRDHEKGKYSLQSSASLSAYLLVFGSISVYITCLYKFKPRLITLKIQTPPGGNRIFRVIIPCEKNRIL